MQVTNDTMRRVPPNGRLAVIAMLIGIAVVPGRLAAQSPAASPAVPDAAAQQPFPFARDERADGPRRARHDSS